MFTKKVFDYGLGKYYEVKKELYELSDEELKIYYEYLGPQSCVLFYNPDPTYKFYEDGELRNRLDSLLLPETCPVCHKSLPDSKIGIDTYYVHDDFPGLKICSQECYDAKFPTIAMRIKRWLKGLFKYG